MSSEEEQELLYSYEDYKHCIPLEKQKWLKEELDFKNPGVDRHLTKIAAEVMQWETLAAELRVDKVAIHSIRHGSDYDTQKLRALQKWHSKRAYNATYEKLLKACVKCEEHEAAKIIIKLLGAERMPKARQGHSSSHEQPRASSQEHHHEQLLDTAAMHQGHGHTHPTSALNLGGASPLSLTGSTLEASPAEAIKKTKHIGMPKTRQGHSSSHEQPRAGKLSVPLSQEHHHEQPLDTAAMLDHTHPTSAFNLRGASPLTASISGHTLETTPAMKYTERLLWSDCNFGALFVPRPKPQFIRTMLNLDNILKELDRVGLLGQGIKLAVLDNGCYSHDSLKHITLYNPLGYSATPMGTKHGTTVTGIVSGRPFLGIPINIGQDDSLFYPGGVAPKAEVKVFKVDEQYSYNSLYKALKDIKEDGTYDIVSLSFRTPPPTEHEQMRLLIEELESHGTFVFAASGNEGNLEKVVYPACVEKVISVGALNYFIKRPEYTNDESDVYCFGEVIAPHGERNALNFVTGTSIATPAVAGLVGLAFQYARSIGYDTVSHKKRIISLFKREKEIKFETLKKIFSDINSL